MYFETQGQRQREEGDAGEAEAAAEQAGRTPRRELLDGPQPGWQKSGATAVKGAGVQLERAHNEALAEQFGGDPERGINSNIILTED